ncbi:MAG: ABC transporter permease [Gemmatimonadaceae bacterium]
MSTLLQDIRYAVRTLLRNPLFTVIGVFTLALGIGLNSAVFSAAEALLLRPLPGVRNSHELVQLYRSYTGSVDYGSSSVPHYMDLRKRMTDVFSGVATWTYVPLSLSTGGRNERIIAQIVSANIFSVLGVGAERGRLFVTAEDVGVGAHPVAVVSHTGWRTIFGSDPQIVGREIVLNGYKYSIVGVTPAEFRGPLPLATPMIWVPLMQAGHVRPGEEHLLENRGRSNMNVIARLAPGVTAEQARQRLTAFTAVLTEEYPDVYRRTGALLVPQSESGIHPQFRNAQVGLTATVMGVVALLLLIACVNVANLFLARARGRWREMSVRLSLGARRGRLVRQLLTESVLFSLLAGGTGLLLASAVISAANGIRLPMDIAIEPDLRVNTTVLVFTVAVSLLTGIIFGLVPALHATRPSLVPALKGEAPAGGKKSRMSRGLVVAQLALSLTLLVVAGLFGRSLRSATAIDKGFNSDNLLTANVDVGLQGYSRPRGTVFFAQLKSRLEQLPNVRAVGYADIIPLSLNSQQRGVTIPGYTPQENERMEADYASVTPGYFEAMAIPILAGRTFTARDDSASAPVLIVNQQFAQRFWKGGDPLGRIVRLAERDFTVVGMVPNGKYRTLGEDPIPYMYTPHAQAYSDWMTIFVRTTGEPLDIAPALRSEVAALDANLPISDLRTMNSALGTALLPARLTGSVIGIFGVLGLVLAAVGLYGVMSYSVAQRTREIGIRVAVGAGDRQVLGLVMRQGMLLVAIGTVFGVTGAFAAWRLSRGLLYGDTALDPITLIGVIAVLSAVALLAIWVPARRAARVDPIVALKTE